MQEMIYANWITPAWAPPAWIFGPVWTLLYIIIAISFGWVFWQVWKGSLPKRIIWPFIINLIANFLYTPIQFGLQSFPLATANIITVWITIVVIIVMMWDRVRWISYAQFPYLAWVSFAMVLQFSITWLNW